MSVPRTPTVLLKLDRFVHEATTLTRRNLRAAIAQGHVTVQVQGEAGARSA